VETVLVALPHTDGRRRVTSLRPGDQVRFGRDGSEVELKLPDAAVSRLAGEIVATADHWCLSNLSRESTYVVENPEGAGEHMKVPPGRVAAPVPFEISRVLVPTQRGIAFFEVFAPAHSYLERPATGDGEPTISALPLDVTSKYFLVLLALCEPRLRDESRVRIPTVVDVVKRLQSLSQCREITADAVAFHIDYLTRTKLRFREPGETTDVGSSRREALVSRALRFNLVRETHLALLPPRSRLSEGASA
jgi:serine/threonine-protein kinase